MTPTTHPQPRLKRLSEPDIRRPLLAALITFLVVLIIGGLRVDSGFVSPFDEGYHLSYVQYASEGYVPRTGDPMSRWAEDAYSCYEVPPYGVVTSVPCGVDGPSELYPEAGTNTAAVWPPTYYLMAGAWTRAGVSLFGADPLLAARWFSALLWAAGAALLAGMAARHSQKLALSTSLGILCGTAPAAYSKMSYVTPHSAVLLLGAGALGFGLWAMRTSAGLPARAALGAATGAVIALTIPHGVAVALVIAAALPAWSLIEGTRLWSNIIVGSAVVGSVAVVGLAWALTISARALPVETFEQPTTEPETLPVAILNGWQLFMPPGGGPDQFNSSVESAFIAALGYLIVGAIGYHLLSRKVTHQRALAIGLVLAVPLTGAAATYMFDFPVPPRYAATVIPIYYWMLSRRDPEAWYTIVIGVVAVVSVWLAATTDYLTL